MVLQPDQSDLYRLENQIVRLVSHKIRQCGGKAAFPIHFQRDPPRGPAAGDGKQWRPTEHFGLFPAAAGKSVTGYQCKHSELHN